MRGSVLTWSPSVDVERERERDRERSARIRAEARARTERARQITQRIERMTTLYRERLVGVRSRDGD